MEDGKGLSTLIIEKLQPSVLDAWWQNFDPEEIPKENKALRYSFAKFEKKLPINFVLTEMAKLANISFTTADVNSNEHIRNSIADHFNLEVDDNMEPSSSEELSLNKYLERIYRKDLLHWFGLHAHQVLIEIGVAPVHARMAISKGELLFEMGARNTLTFKEKEEWAEVGFMIATETAKRIRDAGLEEKRSHYNIYPFPGDPKVSITRIKIDHQQEIPEEFLNESLIAIRAYYEEVKGTKLSKIREGAGTTNTALKKALFDGIPLNEYQMNGEMAKSKGFITVLAQAVKRKLEADNHDLAKHRWEDKHSPKWWWISALPNGVEPASRFLHYEIIIYSKHIAVELHPEGSKTFKQSFEPFIDKFTKPPYGIDSWNDGARGSKEFRKIVPSKKTIKYEPSETEPSWEQVNAVTEERKKMYETFNADLLHFFK